MWYLNLILAVTIGTILGCMVGNLLLKLLFSIGQSKKMGKSTIKKESELDA